MGKDDEAPSDRFVIAALGASAGGLEALENFFKHTPPDTGIGFIVVQHLAPGSQKFTSGAARQAHSNAGGAGTR